MKVYVVVEENWNVEYGYNEYSLPRKIFASEEAANEYADEMSKMNSYSTYVVEDYIVE
ncbi:hypothetical protein CPTPhageEI1_143 [Klebsiella phage EI]|jgi:hypothetical protein|nr:hypothetical protein CPTPhageEI1_143 [Klebsiella phage EI]